MDLYGKTFLAKVAHIFIVYHPLKERKSVSVTKHKIWGIEICPKMSLSRPDFTFWALSQDRDAPGQIYLTTSDHHGCRNLGQHQSKIFWIFPRNELLLIFNTIVLSTYLIFYSSEVKFVKSRYKKAIIHAIPTDSIHYIVIITFLHIFKNII